MPLLEATLSCGHDIWAESLFIDRSYAGMLEGAPFEEFNDMIIEEVSETLTTIFGDLPVSVIEPVRKALVAPDNWREEHKIEFHRSKREVLPEFWVGASFVSMAVDEDHDMSALIVAWFQDVPSPIPNESSMARIKELNWDALAKGFNY